jgi:CcmD family protein
MTSMHYLLLGYGLIWLGLGLYLVQMNRRIRRVHGDIAERRERMERAGRS